MSSTWKNKSSTIFVPSVPLFSFDRAERNGLKLFSSSYQLNQLGNDGTVVIVYGPVPGINGLREKRRDTKETREDEQMPPRGAVWKREQRGVENSKSSFPLYKYIYYVSALHYNTMLQQFYIDFFPCNIVWCYEQGFSILFDRMHFDAIRTVFWQTHPFFISFHSAG